MLSDAASWPPGKTLSTHVCVVGAGAAGITLARELGRGGIDVVLLESGGFEPDLHTQALYAGPVEGDARQITDGYATQSRLRYFGGSTNHWAGQCRPLDPLDFERRDWIPDSGWPFDRAALDPYYQRASMLLGLPPLPDGVARDEPGGADLAFPREHDRLVAKPFGQAPVRFGLDFRDDLVASPRVAVCLRANAVEIETNREGTAALGVRTRTLDGRQGRVMADRIVLATGAVENARLLLASRRVQRHGLGNAHDLVGRFFMDHPHGLSGIGLAALWKEAPPRLFLPDRMTLFYAAPAWQRLERSSGVAANLIVGPARLAEKERALVGAAHDFDLGATPGEPLLAEVRFRAEQTPNPESRVTLDATPCALGVPRAKIAWHVRDDDLRSIDAFLHMLARELGVARVGRARIDATRETLLDLVVWGHHHLGTTRMHGDPKHGVTDTWGRVHGLANLFVAGSSLFPTSGTANPTLTILALALRLADHLATRMEPQ